MSDIAIREIGVRELKNQATEILRDVREQQAEYVVTYHGKPVARILPFETPVSRVREDSVAISAATREDMWAEWDELAREIDENWQVEQSAVELLFEMRRDRERALSGTK